jgi:hypothetical protein
MKCVRCPNLAVEEKTCCEPCLQVQRQKSAKHYQTHRQECIATTATAKKNNRERYNGYSRQTRARRKEAVFAMLGNKCAWPSCEWTDPRALQIDHKFGGGCKELKGLAQETYLKKVLADGGKNYQLLCANHNWIKRAEQGEALTPRPS